MMDFYAESEKTKEIYYCGNRLIAASDRRGEKPELFLVSGNRTGGKTTWFTGKLIYDFLRTGDLFVVLVRHNNQLGSVAEGILEAGRNVYFPEYTIREKTTKNGFSTLMLYDGEKESLCGYGVSINASDNIKRVSSQFLGVSQCYFDEFMSEKEDYLKNEVTNFLSVHTSLARGKGMQHKYLPVYMSSNATSITNPYFTALRLTDKIQPNTKFFRGDGFVYERTYQASAAEAQKKSGMSAAFADAAYLKYATDNTWLNDNVTGIEKPDNWGRSIYQHTIAANGHMYGVYYYPDVGVYYISRKFESTCPNIFSIGGDDITLRSMRMTWALNSLKRMLLGGAVRFQDIACKKALSPLLYL